MRLWVPFCLSCIIRLTFCIMSAINRFQEGQNWGVVFDRFSHSMFPIQKSDVRCYRSDEQKILWVNLGVCRDLLRRKSCTWDRLDISTVFSKTRVKRYFSLGMNLCESHVNQTQCCLRKAAPLLITDYGIESRINLFSNKSDRWANVIIMRFYK